MILAICMLVLGALLGLFVPPLILAIRMYGEQAKINAIVKPAKVDTTKLCKTPHSWIKTTVLTDEGRVERQLCRICGFVSGTEFMASPEAIDKIEDQNAAYEIEKSLYDEFLNKEDTEIKKFFESELASGVLNFDKLGRVHAAGMTFSTRFSMYKAVKAPEMTKERSKGNA